MPRGLWAKLVDAFKGDSSDEQPQPRGVDDFLGEIGTDAPQYTGHRDGGAVPPIAPRKGAEFALMEAPPTDLPSIEVESSQRVPSVRTPAVRASESEPDGKGGWDALDF